MRGRRGWGRVRRIKMGLGGGIRPERLEKGVLEKAKGEGLGRGGVRLGEEKGSPMQVGGESAGAGSKRGRRRGAPPGAGYHTMEETRSSTISPSRSTPSDLET